LIPKKKGAKGSEGGGSTCAPKNDPTSQTKKRKQKLIFPTGGGFSFWRRQTEKRSYCTQKGKKKGPSHVFRVYQTLPVQIDVTGEKEGRQKSGKKDV